MVANSRSSGSQGSMGALASGTCSAAVPVLRKILLMRAWVYCIKGPVKPWKSILSSGLNNIFFFGSTRSKKNFKAPIPIISFSACNSVTVKSFTFPNSAVFSAAMRIILSTKSSASTTVPSLLFILPVGNSTIP